MLHALVKQSAIEGYSDLHIEPLFDGIARIRARQDGKLKDLDDSALVNEGLKHFIGYVKNKSGMRLEENRRPQDGSIIFTEEDFSGNDKYLRNYSLRVSTVPLINGEKIVMRVHNDEKDKFNLCGLGFSDDILQKINDLIKLPKGLILVTGPTGSGKTRTLYSILEELNNDSVNIMTIENPVEKKIHGINQSNTNVSIDWDYPNVLEKYLRQDPDIILVGEIRNKDSAHITLEAAKTGHLVFSTLHANDSVRTMMRMKDFDILRSDLYDSFAGVISQRLVQRLCGCSHESAYDARMQLEDLLKTNLPEITLHKPSGKRNDDTCPSCEGRGYKGRLPVTEVWVIGDEEKELISKGEDSPEIYMQAAIKGGMKPMVVYGFEKVLDGETTIDELLTEIPYTDFAKRKDLLLESLRNHNIKTESAKKL